MSASAGSSRALRLTLINPVDLSTSMTCTKGVVRVNWVKLGWVGLGWVGLDIGKSEDERVRLR